MLQGMVFHKKLFISGINTEEKQASLCGYNKKERICAEKLLEVSEIGAKQCFLIFVLNVCFCMFIPPGAANPSL